MRGRAANRGWWEPGGRRMGKRTLETPSEPHSRTAGIARYSESSGLPFLEDNKSGTTGVTALVSYPKRDEGFFVFVRKSLKGVL